MEGKTPSESMVEMTEIILPNDANALGNLLGGRMMHWIDICGAMAATRHCLKPVVTACVDSLDFRRPIRVGELIMLKAKLTWVGRTSMEVKVKVFVENLKTGELILTNKAYLTFVALDEEGKPTPVPPLYPETDEEKKDYEEGEARRNARLNKKRARL